MSVVDVSTVFDLGAVDVHHVVGAWRIPAAGTDEVEFQGVTGKIYPCLRNESLVTERVTRPGNTPTVKSVSNRTGFYTEIPL